LREVNWHSWSYKKYPVEKESGVLREIGNEIEALGQQLVETAMPRNQSDEARK